MENLQRVSLVLDGLLVLAAVLAYLSRPRIGGKLADGLRILLIGIAVLGLGHLVESLLFVVVKVDAVVNEVVHRVLVGLGFVFVIWGFIRMRQAFEE